MGRKIHTIVCNWAITARQISTIVRVFTIRGKPGLIPTISPDKILDTFLMHMELKKEDWGNFEREVEEFYDLKEVYDRNLNTLSSGMSGRADLVLPNQS